MPKKLKRGKSSPLPHTCITSPSFPGTCVISLLSLAPPTSHGCLCPHPQLFLYAIVKRVSTWNKMSELSSSSATSALCGYGQATSSNGKAMPSSLAIFQN